MNRLAKSNNPGVTAPLDPEERVRFWIDRGNANLWSNGRTDLHWRHSNGHYFIEPR